MNREQVMQNLIDRGRALDEFMKERFTIIETLSKIHRIRRTEKRLLENLEMNLIEERLLQQLEFITNETERKLTEIRQRRTRILQQEQQQQ